jgi:predicted transcriptional regulator
MARPLTPTLTPSERKILEVLWKKREATVREVADDLSQKAPVAYNTVLTMLRILEKKGCVTHVQQDRAFIYRPAISRSEAIAQALEQLLKNFFNGSPQVLAQHLIENESDDMELDSLRRMVEAAQEKESKK